MGVQVENQPPVSDARALLCSRLEELRISLQESERESSELTKRLRLLRSFFARSQGAWSDALDEIGDRGVEHAIKSRAEDMLDICTEIGRAEAQLESAIETTEMRRQQLRAFEMVLAELPEGTSDGATLELKGVRYARALRQLNDLARRDHESIANRLVTGPMQDLVEFTTNLEVIEQQVSSGSALDRKELRSCRAPLHRASKSMRQQLSVLSAPRTVEQCVRSLRATLDQLGEVEGRLDVIGDPTMAPAHLAVPILRIAQVAVRNAFEHSDAAHIDVTLSITARGVTLVVRDDGDGFDVGATETRLGKTGGVGILSMRERAELAGGTLDIRSAVDVGTEVRAVFPAKEPSPAPLRAVHAARQ
jgi:signal transduction histidine kinase